MPVHEQKNCPRCNQLLECKVGDIGRCQCTGIYLSEEVQAFIEAKYNDCLCMQCLKILQNKCSFFEEKYGFKSDFGDKV